MSVLTRDRSLLSGLVVGRFLADVVGLQRARGPVLPSGRGLRESAIAGPVFCPAGKQALNAGLANLSADQAWVGGVASDPFGVVQNGAAFVGPTGASNPGPGSRDFLRNPVPAISGQTADATGRTLALTGVRFPIWHQTAYGMTVNIWLACMVAG